MRYFIAPIYLNYSLMHNVQTVVKFDRGDLNYL